MKRLALSIAAAAAAFALAGQASAEIVTLTYQGTVSGTDVGGVFGSKNAVLDGDAFTAVLQFDLSKGTPYTGASAGAYGGTQYGDVSPLLNATVTIGGVAHDMTTDYYGEIFGYNDGVSFSEQYQEVQYQNGDFVDLEYYAFSTAIPEAVDQPKSISLASYNVSGNLQVGATSLGLTPTTLTEAVVPEPATWALLLLGIGGLGLALRSRRAATVSPARV